MMRCVIHGERELRERSDGFEYDLRMHCACGKASALTQADYEHLSTRGARIPCEHCGNDIHFGPAVAALRDDNDPALRDDTLDQLAWYHTSTWSDWPSAAFRESVKAQLTDPRALVGISPEAWVEMFVGKALHVGTYEAAVENMLRRMDDEGDADEQFYLHRVALHLPPGSVNRGYRDENHEVASDISVSELQQDGLLAVRYLNVREASGTISLAVQPQAITAVQTLAIPITELAGPVSPNAAELAFVLDAARAAEREARALAPADHRELRMRQLGRPDPDGSARRFSEAQRATRAARDALEERLAADHLPGVPAMVKAAFLDALRGRRPNDDAIIRAQDYATFSALLTRSRDVQRLVSATESRRVLDLTRGPEG